MRWLVKYDYVQLGEEAKKVLQAYRKQKPDTTTFEIYTNFQQLVKLSENVEEKWEEIILLT